MLTLSNVFQQFRNHGKGCVRSTDYVYLCFHLLSNKAFRLSLTEMVNIFRL